MASKPKDKTQKTTIKVEKNLTLKNISELNKEFLAAIKKGSPIELISSDIDNLDLSGLQFIYYTKALTKEKKIDFNISLSFTDNAKMLIRKTGFAELLVN